MMSQEKKQEQNNSIRESDPMYGFPFNLHKKNKDINYRIEFFEKITTKFATSTMAIVLFIVKEFFIVFTIVIYLLSAPSRAQFMTLPLLSLGIVLSGFALMDVFSHTSGGTLFSNSIMLIHSIRANHLEKKGKKTLSKKTGIADIQKDGMIKFSNGDVGILLSVDGNGSRTAYPQEMERLKNALWQYNRVRSRTTTEIMITSSMQQDATEQIENINDLIDSNSKKIGIVKMLQYQKNVIERDVDGVRPVIDQHLLIRTFNIDELNKSVQYLTEYNSKNNLYYSITQLKEKEVSRVLEGIYSFH